MESDELIKALVVQTKQVISQIEKINHSDLSILTWREAPSSWNILECLQHLNLYGNFYLPQIERAIKNSPTKPDIDFKSGILGGYFAKSMLPKEKPNTMKTFKDKNPLNTSLNKKVIEKFIDQQIMLLELLDRSRHISLNKVKIETSISSFIKLKLGDTFQFLINHIIRHLQQIEKIQLAMLERGVEAPRVVSK